MKQKAQDKKRQIDSISKLRKQREKSVSAWQKGWAECNAAASEQWLGTGWDNDCAHTRVCCGNAQVWMLFSSQALNSSCSGYAGLAVC